MTLLLVLACHYKKEQPPHPKTQTEINRVQPDSTSKELIYFGFITRYNPRVMYDEYQPIIDYLSQVTPYQFELKLGKTYEDEIQLLKNHTAQIVSFGAVTYLMAHHLFDARPILKPLNKEGSPFYRSIFIVRDDSDIQTLQDLKGRTLALASPHSTSGNLIPRFELYRHGIALDELEQVQNFRHHDSVVKQVLYGNYDAGAVKDVIAYRYLSKGLRIIHRSDNIPSVPITVHNDTPETLVNILKKALLAIRPDSTGEWGLTRGWNEEFRYGFMEAKDEDYAGIRAKMNQIPGGCALGCHTVPEL